MAVNPRYYVVFIFDIPRIEKRSRLREEPLAFGLCEVVLIPPHFEFSFHFSFISVIIQ